MRKKVAISQRVDEYPDRQETRDALDQKLSEMLAQAGFLPLPVPNSLGNAQSVALWCAEMGISAVVLSGGNDIGSCAPRDMTEGALLDWAADRKVPVLGICRGMQMLVCHAGGSLKQVSDHVRTRHKLSGNLPYDVNSYHDQAIDTLPDCYDVLARAEDDTVEAIKHKTLPWMGWMWHPEREAGYLDERLKGGLTEMAEWLGGAVAIPVNFKQN